METTIPEAVRSLSGEIVDVDTHEMMPAQVWVDTFGEVARRFADTVMAETPDNPNHSNVPGYAGDVAEITPQSVWSSKGCRAPGAADPSRRLEVMDLMGVDRQLMFPTGVGLWGQVLFQTSPDSGLFPDLIDDRKNYARRLWAANNEWAVGVAKASRRIRPVTPVWGETVDELLQVTRDLLDRGIRALWLASSSLPGGKSPAHSDLDPFYATVAEADAALMLHLGAEFGFLTTEEWRNAPAFEGFKVTGEASLDPWSLSSIHLASQNFVATMVTGGVFERHPSLRFGAIELGAHWIGPLSKMLDMWYDAGFTIGMKKVGEWKGQKTTLRPSEYIQRNLRVTAFPFEPVDEYIDRYGLEDVYCFASDYPHVEGGKDPIPRLSRRLDRHGAAVQRKFFKDNAELLFPNSTSSI